MAEIEDFHPSLSTDLTVFTMKIGHQKPLIFYRFYWITSQFLTNLLLPRDYQHFRENLLEYTQVQCSSGFL